MLLLFSCGEQAKVLGHLFRPHDKACRSLTQTEPAQKDCGLKSWHAWFMSAKSDTSRLTDSCRQAYRYNPGFVTVADVLQNLNPHVEFSNRLPKSPFWVFKQAGKSEA